MLMDLSVNCSMGHARINDSYLSHSSALDFPVSKEYTRVIDKLREIIQQLLDRIVSFLQKSTEESRRAFQQWSKKHSLDVSAKKTQEFFEYLSKNHSALIKVNRVPLIIYSLITLLVLTGLIVRKNEVVILSDEKYTLVSFWRTIFSDVYTTAYKKFRPESKIGSKKNPLQLDEHYIAYVLKSDDKKGHCFLVNIEGKREQRNINLLGRTIMELKLDKIVESESKSLKQEKETQFEFFINQSTESINDKRKTQSVKAPSNHTPVME